MSWHLRLGAFVGFMGCIGIVACTLDQSGTSILPESSSESSSAEASSGSAQASSGSQGAGGAGGGSGAGQGAGPSGSTTGGQGGGSTCDMTPPPNPSIINCDLQGECQAPIHCMMGGDCLVNCTGPASCKGTVINCAPGRVCRVVCNAAEACQGAIINCGSDGVCELQCGNQAQACTGTLLICSAKKCTATCNGSSMPTVQCSNSCMCTPCM